MHGTQADEFLLVGRNQVRVVRLEIRQQRELTQEIFDRRKLHRKERQLMQILLSRARVRVLQFQVLRVETIDDMVDHLRGLVRRFHLAQHIERVRHLLPFCDRLLGH